MRDENKVNEVFYSCPDCEYRTRTPYWVAYYGENMLVHKRARPRLPNRGRRHGRPDYLEPICPRCYDADFAPPPTKSDALMGDLPEMEVEGTA